MSMRKAGLSRRTVGLGAAAAAALAYVAAPRIGGLLAPELEFEPMTRPEGFRRIAGGGVSSGFDMFVGIDGEPDPALEGTVAAVRDDLCATLFHAGTGSTDVVPIASFSDYNCPYCRVLTKRLAEIEAAGGVALSWHELPLLGEASVTAARGALAAARQGAYAAFHERLMTSSFQTTPEYLEALAQSIGVDAERLEADMRSDVVAREILRSRAVARAFGFIGTPAIVVGRTVVQGEIGERTLRRLIAREREDGPVPACAEEA
jgi:protein-disulfide isomerase